MFSLHYTLQWKGSFVDAYRDLISEARYAEQSGFKGVYVGEHHFAPDGWCPAPITTLASIASITSRIQLGTDILQLSLHNPIMVAENISVLDNISNGRITLGVGHGFREVEYKAFGVPLQARVYDEKLKVVKDLLQGSSVQVDGANLEIFPKPVQRPRPRIWVAAKSPKAVRRSVHRGDAWVMDPVTPAKLLEERLKVYKEELMKVGKRVRDFPLRRECFVSKDNAELKKAERLILKSYEEDYYAWGHLVHSDGTPVDPKVTPYGTLRDALLEEMVIGKPSVVVEKLDRYRKRLGATEFLLKLMFPGITHSMRMSSIKLIGKEVAPHFA